HHLLDGAGSGIRLQRQDAAHDRPARDDVAEPQRRRDRLRKRADIDHAVIAGHAAHGLRTLAVPHEVGIALVLEDRHAVALAELDHSLAPLGRQDARRRILYRWDRVEILGPYALGLEVGEDTPERFDVEALLVERRRNHVDAEAPHSAQKAAVTRFLDDDRVTLFEQQRIDELES